MRYSRYVLSCLSAFAVVVGCGGNDGGGAAADNEADGAANVPTLTGGSTDSGGAKASGGSTGSGGAKATGGSTGSGGAKASGGSTGSGGATGTGGTVGSGGGPPHVVGACNGLGAVDQWEDITPQGANLSDNGVVEILVDPVTAGTIYTAIDKQGVHKSTDCGATWTKVNTGKSGAVIDSGTQWTMAIDPVEPNVLYAGNLYGSDPSLFKSVNSGLDWDSLFPPGSEVAQTVDYNFFQEVSMDPTDHQHLVVSFHANCKGAYAPMCMAESKDAGATWRLFKGPTSGWGEDARPLVLGATTWLYVTLMDGLFYTSDSGATWENVGSAGHHQFYRAKDGTYYMGSVWGVVKSPDGHAWTKIDGSPNGDGITGDGKRIFNSLRDASTQQPYFAAMESDGTKWSALSSPNMGHGGVYLKYDSDHHVLYSANTKSGLWRMVTQ